MWNRKFKRTKQKYHTHIHAERERAPPVVPNISHNQYEKHKEDC